MRYRQKVVWLKFEPRKNQEINRAVPPNPCAKRLVQLFSRRTDSVHFLYQGVLHGNDPSNHPQDLHYTVYGRIILLSKDLDGKISVRCIKN